MLFKTTTNPFPAAERWLWALFVSLPLAYLLTSVSVPKIAMLIYGEGPIPVTIQATGEKAPNSHSFEVWVEKVPGMPETPGWEVRGDTVVSYKQPYPPLRFDIPVTSKGVVFFKQAWSGKVKVTSGSWSITLDLYSKTDSKLTITPYELVARSIGISFTAIAATYAAFLIALTAILRSILRRDALLAIVVDRPISSKNLKYVSRLDHLRFLAAAMVIFYHRFTDNFGLGHSTFNPLLGLIEQGHMGVGLFMVLSGYLLASIAYGREIRYTDFIKNRILRIYPLYMLCVIVMMCGWRLDYSFTQALSLIFPFVNALQDVKLPAFGHLWTIAVEFQFYLLFPFLFRFLEEKGPAYGVGLLSITILLKILLWKSTGSVTNVAYITLLGRIDQFLIGMLVAYLAKRYLQDRTVSPMWLVGSICFVGIVMSVFCGNEGLIGLDQSWLMALWPSIEAVMWASLIVAYANAKLHIPDSIDFSLARLGQLSFSMYCMHYVVIAFTKDWWVNFDTTAGRFINVNAQSALLTVPCVVLFSMLTYGVVEKPFLSLKSKYASIRADRAHATQ